MLSIFAKIELHPFLKETISTEHRLDELIDVIDFLEHRPIPSTNSILIRNNEIGFMVDWYNLQPPFILPEAIELNKSNLLGIIFAKLANYEKAMEHLQPTNPSLFKELDFINRLQNGIHLEPQELISNYTPFEEYRLMHNNAIVRHYSIEAHKFDPSKIAYYYEQAMSCAPNSEYEAYTICHYAQFCMDLSQSETSVRLLDKASALDISEEAMIAVKHNLSQAWLQQLTVPYDQDLLERLKSTLWEVLEAFEKTNRNAETGLLLLDASFVANISDSFSESLGYVTRAIRIFEEEDLRHLAGNAHYRKGTLLYTWAQKGNPQFFKPAIESYQQALKVFTKEEAPDVFADIHHNLGVLYVDMPSENTKKSIWAGVAVSSFDEALNYYTKERFPYQYGMICNNYGNAFTKFPKAALTDNHEKALFYYQEALDVRTADYPFERAITLLNYLEASWDVGNDPENFNEDRFNDMIAKAQEVKRLDVSTDMKKEAEKHLNLLKQLEEVS
ncbi:MAG: hypothetical protein AAGA77_15425 [Bacteroidota bacterium]